MHHHSDRVTLTRNTHLAWASCWDHLLQRMHPMCTLPVRRGPLRLDKDNEQDDDDDGDEHTPVSGCHR